MELNILCTCAWGSLGLDAVILRRIRSLRARFEALIFGFDWEKMLEVRLAPTIVTDSITLESILRWIPRYFGGWFDFVLGAISEG